ncbi:MAG TPA: hypothetical protein VMT95_11780 [Candidatus Binatia bacterium]|nr:hypothetical protein [Candidatus Binatia bacterium]
MARSDPARSDYCATRHLLRSLGDARELKRNPLARDALRAIEARVNAALRELNARHAAILLRVDVERHDPRRVAADLALSTRQFHRERRAAHDRFVAAYRYAGFAPAVVGVDDGFAQRVVERATSLADSGESASAAAMLDDVVRSGADTALRCDALTRLAQIDAWTHRLDRAQTRLSGAQSVLEFSPLSDERRAELRDSIAAAELTLRWFAKGPAAVTGAGRGGPRETLTRAAAALRCGEAAHAVQLVQTLNENALALRAPEVAVDVLALRAELADFNAEDPLRSEALFARAASLAREAGLGGRALYAEHQLALTRWMHSRSAHDRSAYRRLVDHIDWSLPARLRSYLIFSAADVELAIGDPRRALAAAQSAGGVSTNRYETFSAHGFAAGALLRMGRVADAGAQAARAADAARAEGHPRVLGLAQRISAQAFLAQGNRRAARAAIDESIECARYFSSPYVLAQAQAVLGRIAGR